MPKQEMMTRDNVPVTVDAVVYFRVIEPEAAITKVEKFLGATSLLAQTTLRSVIGQAELDELLSQRERINQRLQEIIDRHTDPWGIKVTVVEVKDVALPDTMKRAMAGQAESERERRATWEWRESRIREALRIYANSLFQVGLLYVYPDVAALPHVAWFDTDPRAVRKWSRTFTRSRPC